MFLISTNLNPIHPHHGAKEKQYKNQIVWINVIVIGLLHLMALYGSYYFLCVCQWSTAIYGVPLTILSGTFGITAGAHRLWAHRAYKANLPLRILLMISQTLCFQNHIYHWVRDHRVHHKFTETDADPHNAKRGFFFSHVGWLMVKKHKDVIAKGKSMDLSDLDADPVVQFQRKYYLILLPICFTIPVLIPIYFFGEDAWVSFLLLTITRWVYSVNGAWLVNSAAHRWGSKPYDNSIRSTENSFVACYALGEGFHNYHHAFPWDYKAAELGNYRLNLTLLIIDFFAKIGWAYDLKTVSKEMVEKRIQRSGDGSHPVIKPSKIDNDDHHHHDNGMWGWGDTDMNEEEIHDVKVYNKLTED